MKERKKERNSSWKKKIQLPEQLWCFQKQTTSVSEPGKHSTAVDFFFLLLKQLHWRSSIFALRKCLKSPARCFKHYKTTINHYKNFPSAVGGKDVNPASSSSRALAPWWSADKARWVFSTCMESGCGNRGGGGGQRLGFHWLHTSDGAIRFPRLPVNI